MMNPEKIHQGHISYILKKLQITNTKMKYRHKEHFFLQHKRTKKYKYMTWNITTSETRHEGHISYILKKSYIFKKITNYEYKNEI
jgi:hypothetical protein